MAPTNGHAKSPTTELLADARAEAERRYAAYAAANAAVDAARQARKAAADAADAQDAVVRRLEAAAAWQAVLDRTPPELAQALADAREAIAVVRRERSALFADLRKARAEQWSTKVVDRERVPDAEAYLSGSARAADIEQAIARLDEERLQPLASHLARLEQDQLRPPPAPRQPVEPIGPRTVREVLSASAWQRKAS